MDKGKLYIVATPIGNLKDITFRAIDTLKDVIFILAEDTRETRKLLNEYGIDTQLISYRDQNHERMIGKVIEKLDMGLDLALVSDCGTPLISDPGYKLVRDLREKGYEVLSIPG
ncbi:TPA: 16S rRNA (cytidine(1402)-2'-O)-methyltransferase, partial [Patescibacteria group bacterium]|nr:16S rRNA (cytidine(1402)-2'-O)-methyltransferase [Patescibacteria group bacterium]